MDPCASETMTINPDDYLTTENGRVWTPERNAAAWQRAYQAVEEAVRRRRGARIVVVCGVQGSGKTTWIASQPKSSPVVYFDAALPGIRHRATVLDLARRHGVGIDAVWIRTPLETALARNSRRPTDEIVPVAALLSVANQFEAPTTAEGFDRVHIIETW